MNIDNKNRSIPGGCGLDQCPDRRLPDHLTVGAGLWLSCACCLMSGQRMPTVAPSCGCGRGEHCLGVLLVRGVLGN